MAVHIFIVAGQSNAVGRTLDDFGAYYPAGTYNYTTGGAWAAISLRVLHGTVEAAATDTTFGPDRQFAIDYAVDNPSDTLYFIGAAEGGTGFAAGDWVSGGATYNRAISRINAAIAAAPGGAILKGILWHQGEADGTNDTDASAYAASLATFIDAFRGDITGGASVPFILGGIPQKSANFNAKVQAATMGMRNAKLLTEYASVDFGAEGTFDGGGVHFDAVTQRAMGAQFYKGYQRAVLNTSLGGGGAITVGTPVTANTGTAATQTIAGLSIGTAAADRLVLVGFTNRASASPARVKNASIAGVTLDRIVAPSNLVSGSNVTSWYAAFVPTGTTGDLVVTFSGTLTTNQGGYTIIPVYGARSPVGNTKGHGTLGGGNTYGTSISVNVDVQAGDLLVAQASAQQTAAPSVTIDVAGSTSRGMSANVTNAYAFETIVAASMRTITADFSGVTVNNPSINAFVLRPAGSAGNDGTGAAVVDTAAVGTGTIEISGGGAASTDTAATGAGTVEISGGGGATVNTTSSGAGQADISGSGQADTGTSAAGVGSVAISGTGAAVVDAVAAGYGPTDGEITGAGQAVTDAASISTGSVGLNGTGAATTDTAALGFGAVSIGGDGASSATVGVSGQGTVGIILAPSISAGEGKYTTVIMLGNSITGVRAL